MDYAHVQHLLAGGESETLEFKKSTGQLERGMEVLCSFLNHQGGALVFGVTPKGKIPGQLIGDSTLRDVAERLKKIEPSVQPEIHKIAVPDGDRELLVLKVEPQPSKVPFCFDGVPYQRVGSTTSRMPQQRYHELLLQRHHDRQRWELTEATGFGLADLDEEEIVKTVRRGIAAGRIPDSASLDPGECLDRFGCRVNGRLLNAAVVVFGNRFLPDFPQCHVRMAHFSGRDKSAFIDQRQEHGHALKLLDESMFFLRRNLPVAGRIQPGLFERADEPLFPLEALREALVNAFCHRDYSLPGGSVSLAIYDDRLEVWSDGSLPFDLTVDDLRREHQSRPRNPLIADIFFKRGLVERWGRGTQRIIELCVEAGHPEPVFVERGGAVGIKFLAGAYHPPHRVAHDLSDRQREILQVLGEEGSAPLRQIREELGESVATRTLQKDLAHLRNLGLVDSEGWGRGAYYVLKR